MISILCSGKLTAKPQKRLSKNGNAFVTGQILATNDGEVFLISLICFVEAACHQLIALDKGDDVSIAGSAKPSGWTGRDGSPALGLSIVAQQVMSAYGLKKKRDAVSPEKARYGLPARNPLLAQMDQGELDDDGMAPF